jgi:8-oxo-dGTP pyrophosphatase MutT (NUDIX family)
MLCQIAMLKRFLMTPTYQVLRLYWFLRRPNTAGCRAIALTPKGEIVLIMHSYMPGWHLPGGGRSQDEEPAAAVLRELREEIGLIRHSSMDLFAEYDHAVDFKTDRVSLFVVRDIAYFPRWSFEIAAVAKFALDKLPADVSAATRRRIAEFQGKAKAQKW